MRYFHIQGRPFWQIAFCQEIPQKVIFLIIIIINYEKIFKKICHISFNLKFLENFIHVLLKQWAVNLITNLYLTK